MTPEASPLTLLIAALGTLLGPALRSFLECRFAVAPAKLREVKAYQWVALVMGIDLLGAATAGVSIYSAQKFIPLQVTRQVIDLSSTSQLVVTYILIFLAALATGLTGQALARFILQGRNPDDVSNATILRGDYSTWWRIRFLAKRRLVGRRHDWQDKFSNRCAASISHLEITHVCNEVRAHMIVRAREGLLAASSSSDGSHAVTNDEMNERLDKLANDTNQPLSLRLIGIIALLLVNDGRRRAEELAAEGEQVAALRRTTVLDTRKKERWRFWGR